VKGGFIIIHNGNAIHSAKTYKQAMDYIKKMMKVHKNKPSSSSLEDFL
jgi:L-lactate utilization protein LutB